MRTCSQTFAAALVIASGLVSVVRPAFADVAVPQQSPELSKLLSAFPGVRYDSRHGAPLQFYGVPMTQGETAFMAAEEWLSEFGGAFGVGGLELMLDRDTEVSFGKFNTVVYNQYLDGLPVEMGAVRLLVLNAPTREDPGTLAHRVVMAAGKLAARPAGGFAVDSVDAAQATKQARGHAVAPDLDTWEEPTLCVYFGEGAPTGRVTPVRAWKIGAYSSADHEKSYTFFVNAADGAVVAAQSNVHHDVIGRVRAVATSANNMAPSAGNPPTQRFIPDIRVEINGESGFAYTDASGFFRIPRTATTPVTLHITTTNGRWVNVQNQMMGGDNVDLLRAGYASNNNLITDLTTVGAGGQEQVLSQVDTFLAQNQTHDFFATRAGDWPVNTINERLRANVMLDQTCNAFFSSLPRSVNFFRAGDGCTNTGWGHVVNHEYGHYIVFRLGLAQGAFGEGFSDCMSILINDTPAIGPGFFVNGDPVRHVVNDNVQYPCDQPGASHYCGEILGGTVWEMRNAFVQSLGTTTGMAEMRQLFVDWALITTGGRDDNPVDPTSIPEWLVADDTDGFLCTGTPHHQQILAGFAARNMFPQGDPFVEDRARFTISAPAPEVIPSGTSRTVTMQIVPESATIVPGSARVLYRTARDLPWISVPLTVLANNNYRAQLPVLRCTDAIEYHFAVDTDRGSVAFPTPGCGGGYYFMRSQPPAGSLEDLEPEDFETANAQWTEGVADGAVDGRWQRAVPLGSAFVPNLVPSQDTTGDGVYCWLTKNNPLNGAPEDNDVDAGAVILTTPRIDLSMYTDAIITYNRWFSNGKGTAPFEDIFQVEVSDDDGASWRPVQTIGPGTSPNTTGGWVIDSSFTLSYSGAHTTDRNRLRFVVRDDFADSVVEAAIDDLRITGSLCQQPCDSIDFNRDGLLPDVLDIEDFLSVFSGGPCSTNDCADIDFNNDDLFPDAEDIQALLNAFSGGACD
jgi:hypothetical protein